MEIKLGEQLSRQHTRLLDGIEEFYSQQVLTDVTLTVDGKNFPCHRLVLAASSPYFRAMFTANLIETNQHDVELFDVDPDALSEIIKYLYTSKVNITYENVQSIFTTANLFDLVDLCDICSKFMAEELCVANCITVYQFASFHQCASLKDVSRSYVVNHFSDICDSKDVLSLSCDDLEDIIQDDNLNIRQEERVFECLVRWVEYDIEERKKSLMNLFSQIRFVLMDEHYIKDKVKTCKLILENEMCQNVLTYSKMFLDNQEVDSAEEKDYALMFPRTPRLGMFNRKMMVFVGGSQEAHNRAFTCYDPTNGKNYYAVPLHVSFDFKYRIDHHKAVVNDKGDVYLVGGIFYEDHHFEESGSALNEVRLFDPYHKSWIECTPMKSPRCAHAVVNCKGLIYAIGGKSNYPRGSPLATVECYNTEIDQWRYVEPLPLRLCHHCAVVYKDKIYVLGGKTENDDTTNVFLEYDPDLDIWKSLDPTMRVSRAEFGAVILNQVLYVIGGTNQDMKLSSVEKYDFDTKKWIYGEDFPEERKSMVAVNFDGYILVCGGIRTLISRMNRAPRVVETKDLFKFDPKVGTWERCAKLVQFANVHACVVTEVNTKRLYESEFVSLRRV